MVTLVMLEKGVATGKRSTAIGDFASVRAITSAGEWTVSYALIDFYTHWIRLCLASELESANAFLQVSQRWGFSPVLTSSQDNSTVI